MNNTPVKMASSSWKSRYKEGDFVELMVNEEWVLGVISQVEMKGYYEYCVTLLSDGSVVKELVARDLRSSDVIVQELALDEPLPMPEDPVVPEPPPAVIDQPIPIVDKPKRFGTLREEDVSAMETSAKAQKTIQQTRWGVKIFREWLIEEGHNPAFEEMMAETLAPLLGTFYANVRQKNGQEYSKKSLLCVRSALHRHLTSSPYNVSFNIMSDVIFNQANNTLLGHIKVNKRAGLDVSTSYQAINDEDEKKMYSSKTLSNENPTSLQNKVYYELALHFGRRAREGLHSLKKTDFVFINDSNGKEYATLKHHSLEKNHQGVSYHDQEHEQRMYPTGKDDCPVKSLKMYLGKLHPELDAFFQTPKKKNYRLSTSWYSKSPVGVNTIGKFMTRISIEAKLSKIYTNHCIRATCITKLRDQGVPSKDIKSVTGHRAEASIDFYSKTPDKVREDMSLRLAGAVTSVTPVTSTVSVTAAAGRAEARDEPNFSQTNVVNVSSSSNAPALFSNVKFDNCNFTININK